MRIPKELNIAVIAEFLMLVFLLVPQRGWGASEAKDCGSGSGVTLINYADVLAGPNCKIDPVMDQDTFVFTGLKNDWARLAVALNNDYAAKNICLELYDPNRALVVSGCSDTIHNRVSFVTDQMIPLSGTYTIVVSEQGNDATANYALSLERLFPGGSDAKPLSLERLVTDEINPLTDSDELTFNGRVGDQLRILGALTAGSQKNVCADIIGPDGVRVTGACTDIRHLIDSFQVDLAVTLKGPHVILVYENGYYTEGSYSGTVGYTLSLWCLFGTCAVYPPCTLQATGRYDSVNGNLNLRVLLGTSTEATWNGWLSTQDSIDALWSESVPVTRQARWFTKTFPLPKVGGAGVLTTLTNPTSGITCLSSTLVKTGKPLIAEEESSTDSELDDASSQ